MRLRRRLHPRVAAVDALRDAIQHGAFQAFLLYGVTGSGKTEVYLRAAAECLRTGRGVLFLAPEIALTAQLTQAFRERFGASIAILHSQLSPAERYAQWLRIKQGDAPIVIGARSAVFAPLPNIGLIIIDEEHETAYKQSTAPTYHARTLAEARPRRERRIAARLRYTCAGDLPPRREGTPAPTGLARTGWRRDAARNALD